MEEKTENEYISNILCCFLCTKNHLSFTVRQRFLLVPVLVLLLVNLLTLAQATDSKLKCSDDTLAQHFNCSSTDCVYGEETSAKCTMNKDITCEVN